MSKRAVSGQPFDLSQAAALLSQQIWCWGQDILRPEGNWLLELGFDRTEPPVGYEECPSAYKLALPNDRCVVLRGFGMFYGDAQRGSVFLPRYAFEPRYTTYAELESRLWSDPKPPEIAVTNAIQPTCRVSLLLGAIDWIHEYETKIVARLGIAYRRSTLTQWDDGRRTTIPAPEMVSAWQSLQDAMTRQLPAPQAAGRLTI